MSKSGRWFLKENPNDDINDFHIAHYIDDGYDDYILECRKRAEEHILNAFEAEKKNHMQTLHPDTKVEDVEDMSFGNFSFHEAIWHASKEILPSLEVQVVIDSNNKCFVTTGSSGYVEFGMQPPIGMKTPVRCWIHTHPFGSAYFSGTDIRTVGIWQSMMECAIVIGGIGHYGYWLQDKPYELEIFDNHEYQKTQYWNQNNRIIGGEEE